MVLKNGSRGDEVKDLQVRLAKLGFDVEPDGIYGKGTEGAVNQLQKMFNYTVDGKVGDGTNGLIDAQIGHGWNAKSPDAAERANKANPVKK